LITAVEWLRNHTIDIRCVRLKPYRLDDRILVDVQQIIPPPDADKYVITLRDKVRKQREARASNADFTRFDVRIDNELNSSMGKAKAILLICKHLCARSINPEEISALLKEYKNRVWYWVDGAVDAAEFKLRADAKARAIGTRFDPIRWFLDDGALCQANGKTYAFSSQWGGDDWHRAMNALKERYSEFNIDFTPAA